MGTTMKTMKAISIIIGSTVFAAICFAAGALTAGARHWFEPTVQVSIRNESGEGLAKILLVHESGGKVTTVTLPALKHGQSTDARFYVGDPSGYRLEATFLDGRVVKGGTGYVEAGSSTSEVIGKSATTRTQSFLY
jgi:hypothetical protein